MINDSHALRIREAQYCLPILRPLIASKFQLSRDYPRILTYLLKLNIVTLPGAACSCAGASNYSKTGLAFRQSVHKPSGFLRVGWLSILTFQ
jgi:hypothetical protein